MSLAWEGAAGLVLPTAKIEPNAPMHNGRDLLTDSRAPNHSVALLAPALGIEVFRGMLLAAMFGDLEIVGHNVVFDLLVMIEAAAVNPHSVGPLLEMVFDCLESGVVRDTYIRELLLAIALDQLKGAQKGYFSLAGLVERYLGLDRFEEKGDAVECPQCQGRGHLRIAGAGGGGMCPRCDGFGREGPWRKRYAQLDGVPLDQWPHEASSYAMTDALDTLLVCEAQDRTPCETSEGPAVVGGRVVNEEDQTRAGFALELMSATGVCVDPTRTETLDAEVSRIAEEAKAIGTRAGFIRDESGFASADPTENPKRSKPGSECVAAKHHLVSECYAGAPPRNKPTPTEKAKAELEGREAIGSIKADRDTLLSSGHPLLVDYAATGEALTLARTFVPVLREAVSLGPVAPWEGAPCGPLTSSPNVIVASGRVSWRDPNLTNPPRSGGFRDCIIPRPGCCFVFCDYGTVEFRGLGQICLWLGFGRTIADAFIEGRDPHTEFAADMRGASYETTAALVAAGDEAAKKDRQTAKIANYGFSGGMGAPTFVAHARKQGTVLSEDRAVALQKSYDLHRGFRQKWPEVLSYFSWIGARTGTPDDPRRFTMRQFVSGRLRGGVGYCDGCNGYFQGLVADGAKRAVWRAVRESWEGKGPLAGCRPVLFLHDEIGMEVPCGDGSPRFPLDLGHLTAAADRLGVVMVEAMQPFIPDIPVVAEPAACLRWVKGADEIRNERGLLLPVDLPEGAEVRG